MTDQLPPLPEDGKLPEGPMAAVTLLDILVSAGLDPNGSGAMPRDANDALLMLAHSTNPRDMQTFREELIQGITELGGIRATPGLMLMWWFCGFKAGLEARRE